MNSAMPTSIHVMLFENSVLTQQQDLNTNENVYFYRLGSCIWIVYSALLCAIL